MSSGVEFLRASSGVWIFCLYDAETRCVNSTRNELGQRISKQQVQIDRQEQIINSLKDQLQQQRQQAAAAGGDGMRSRPGSARPPQDLIHLQTENAKLRELVQLLQEKLHDAQTVEDDY